MHDRRLSETPDLHHAAEIAGGDDVRIDTCDMRGFALAERRRDLRLQQIVGAGRAAAEMPLGHVEDVEAGARQKLARRACHALSMLERAGIVISDAIGRGIAGLESKLSQKLGDIAGERADTSCVFAADEMSVVLDRGAAA